MSRGLNKIKLSNYFELNYIIETFPYRVYGGRWISSSLERSPSAGFFAEGMGVAEIRY
jgi:hypothetical protein